MPSYATGLRSDAQVTPAVKADRNLTLILEEFRNYQNGVLPAGPGGRELTAFFQSIDSDLAAHSAAAPNVTATDQHLLSLLSKRAHVCSTSGRPTTAH